MADLTDQSILELHHLLKKGETTATEIITAYLENIQEKNEIINAYLNVLADDALSQANDIDYQIQKGVEISPLTAMPIAIKDNICVKHTKTTCGSRMLVDFIAPYDATVIKKLRQAGAIIIGKTNLDEFGMGSSNENSAFGVVRNPRHLDYVPGGSSGGSAAAVAAKMAMAALGSDTGGSIRQPAAFCGVAGLKPTYGRVSRFGLVAFASSFDQIGPLTNRVGDMALILQTIAGVDLHDSTTKNISIPDYQRALINDDLQGIRIGLPQEFFANDCHPAVENAVQTAISTLTKLGVQCDETSLPHTLYGIEAYYLIANAEASSNLARYDGVRYGYRSEKATDLLNLYQYSRSEGFGAEVKRRVMLGTYILSAGYYEAYYLKAQKVRTLICQDFERAFTNFDLLISPASPTPAFKIGEKIDHPMQMYLSDIFTVPANLAGLPAISIPYGTSSEGLPIGIQIIGKPYDEETILRVANGLQQNSTM